ncbi:MAG TPA: hypothetical protein VNH44_00565 [Micropepsaceae bacterium]|nr:hypothetical protein [Micropepsaceae bacterium]
MTRLWLWVGTGLDLVLLGLAFYMAIVTVDVVGRSDRSPLAIAVAGLFLALPVLCILALFAAWRAQKRRRPPSRIVAMFAAPWIYAAFLMAFLNYG